MDAHGLEELEEQCKLGGENQCSTAKELSCRKENPELTIDT